MKYKKGTKKALRQQKYGSPQRDTRALCLNAYANVVINPISSIDRLLFLKTELSNNVERKTSLHKLYSDIIIALGINSSESSHYGCFNVDDIGFHNKCTLRVSNHNANAANYIGIATYDKNISIVINARRRKNKFKASYHITLIEYCYYDDLIKSCPDLVIKIIDSIIGYLSTGEYVDLSGVAKRNVSP
jgi:hypothetical protein